MIIRLILYIFIGNKTLKWKKLSHYKDRNKFVSTKGFHTIFYCVDVECYAILKLKVVDGFNEKIRKTERSGSYEATAIIRAEKSNVIYTLLEILLS